MATKRHNRRVDIPMLFRLWHDRSIANHEIMRLLDISRSTLYDLQRRHKLPRRPAPVRPPRLPRGPMPNDPSPEEIAERAAEIRRGWSDADIEKRLSGPKTAVRWTPPQYHFNHHGVLTAG
jgi:hypothetical protein